MLTQINIKDIERNWKPRNDNYIITPNARDGNILVWGLDMKEYNCVDFWRLGYSIGQLERTINSPDATVDDIGGYILLADIQLKLLIGNDPGFSKTIKDAARELIKEFNEMQREDTTQRLHDIEYLRFLTFSNSLKEFQTILGREIPFLNIFYITQKRAFNMRMLMEEGELLLSADVVSFLESYTKDI